MLLNRVLFAVSLLLILTTAIFAQNKLKVTGRVLDTSGATVANANVLLNRNDVRFERQAVTDSSGSFEFNNLPEGNYRISATAKTFGTSAKNLQLSKNENSVIDFV
jgi:protocatechuate 3,4-dioxygenase beta subunit